jgi:hypothetical protein
VQKAKSLVPKLLNLDGAFLTLQTFQRVKLWTNRLLSRTLNSYESRLDITASRRLPKSRS